MKQELHRMLNECATELSDIELRINALPVLDQGRRYLSNYALIKACGTVEFIYRSIIADYFACLANSRIDTYLDSTVRQGSNSAKYDNMKKLLNKFDTQWGDDFQKKLQNRSDFNKLISASNSLVRNRHDFAHGRAPSATFLEIKQYYFDVVEIIKVFDSVIK